ncbi:hypothetical protein B0H12DRAFT_333601 [Mycena haematopus]|nr:hypothetical protein B0H12DRAFT_333601 [Mycena haematopus]
MESCPFAARFVLAIPELLDHTIDFLSGSRLDLFSCALVSKSWVPRAQFHIFGKITLLPPNDTELLLLLTKILEVSPHLAHFIRHLSISLNMRLLKGVVGMMLPRLEELYVKCTGNQYGCRADFETKFLVQSLLRLPTIRSVELEGLFNSMSVIHAYFDDCSQDIQRLRLWDVYVDPSPPKASDPDLPISAFVESKIQLSQIIFPALHFRVLDAWINGPHCPFGFHHLRSIHIGADRWRSFQSLLAPCLPSIEYLKLIEFSSHSDLDLGGLTELKWLDVDLDQDWHLPDLLAVLKRLPPTNCLQTMGLLRHTISAEDETIFKDLDAAITALDVLHSLRRVEMDVAVFRPGFDMATFLSYFPTLTSKGYLFVHLPVRTPPEIIYVYDSDTQDSQTDD